MPGRRGVVSLARRAARAGIAATVLLAACGDDTGPESQDITGSYTATQFLLAPTSAPQINVLTSGGSITLVLRADGTLTGQLVVPPSADPDGEGLTADMAGTYVRQGNIVTLEQSADTFMRDVDWQVGTGRLQGQFNGSGGGVFVELTRGS